jgi:DNA polymerase alpha subunit A
MNVDLQMLWEELDTIMTRHKITNWSLQEVSKKYAFEVPDVPAEADWIEINYPYNGW